MNLAEPPSPSDQLVIYLNDHRAGVVGEAALAERCRASNVGTRLGHDLTDHIATIARSRRLLDDLIAQCDGSVDRWKSSGAALAERFGRLKFNGQLTGYSPLSRVLELEALSTANDVRSLLWETCDAIDHPTTGTLDARIRGCVESAGEQRSILRGHLDEARIDAFEPLGAEGAPQ